MTEHSHWRSQGEHTVTLGIISPSDNKFATFVATFESPEVELPYLTVKTKLRIEK